jgi:hypothetical protein
MTLNLNHKGVAGACTIGVVAILGAGYYLNSKGEEKDEKGSNKLNCWVVETTYKMLSMLLNLRFGCKTKMQRNLIIPFFKSCTIFLFVFIFLRN